MSRFNSWAREIVYTANPKNGCNNSDEKLYPVKTVLILFLTAKLYIEAKKAWSWIVSKWGTPALKYANCKSFF